MRKFSYGYGYPVADEPFMASPPPRNMVDMSPLQAGLQLGFVGAGAGLGVAAIRQSILRKHGDPRNISPIKPLLLGATIGSALGVGIGVNNRMGSHTTPPLRNWQELPGSIYGDSQTNKYAGLRIIAESNILNKTANKAWGAAKGVADFGADFIPGVGTTRYGYSAVKGLGKGVGNLVRGNIRQGLGNIAGGIGSAALSAVYAIPGGALLGKSVKGLKAGKRAVRLGMPAAKGLKANIARRVGSRMSNTALYKLQRGAGKAKNLGGLLQKTKGGPGIAAKHLTGLGITGSLASGLGGSGPVPNVPSVRSPAIPALPPLRIPRQRMPQINVPRYK